ncbi:MAG: ATP-binding protein [Fuscovulum sp.]|nr:MAG: ATP-binding protein [Fuscovulum sp.]
MALSLQNLVRKTSDKPPRIIIYGRGKMGKTTLASEFPDPIFIQTEEGEGNIEVTTFAQEPLKKYAEIEEAIELLLMQDHDFKTVVIDSLTQLEPIIWSEVCRKNNWNSIEDAGYGKGYIEADTVWRHFLDGLEELRRKGMTIVMIAHEQVEQFSDPERDDYSRYKIRLHKRAEAMVRERADVVGFLNMVVNIDKTKQGFGKEVVKAKGSGQRTLHLAPKPTFEAGNRYEMPPFVLVNPGEGYAAIAGYLPGQSVKKQQQAA